MHEVRATVPLERSAAVARIALNSGISNVSIYEVFVHGPERRKHVVSVECSTPKAKTFIDALLSSPAFDVEECSLSSRELRAIFNSTPLPELTQPMVEPAPDVIEYLWQMSHLTPSYAGRAIGGAILLADGVIRNSAISIVVAALFLPFLSPVLAAGFGAWSADWRLVRKGLLALLMSTISAFAGGALVGWLMHGPIQFHDFKGPLASFAISAVIVAAAGLSSADDAGRHYLIGVAAAVQFAIFPVWLGAASVIGLPSKAVVVSRMGTLLINLVTIAGAAVVAYALTGIRREELRRMSHVRFSKRRGS